MGRSRVLVVCVIAFLGLCVNSGVARRGPPPPLKPGQPALSKPEIEEIRAFASNAYRHDDQMSSFSHFVGRRVKNRPVQSHQQPFAVIMRRPMRPPRKEVIQTSASQNSNSYFSYRPSLSNHILPLSFFSAFKPKRPNLFRRPPQPFTYSHPPTIFSGEPTAAQIQAEHQKKLEALVNQQQQQQGTGTQQAQKSPEVSQKSQLAQSNSTTTDENGVRNQQSLDGKIVKSKDLSESNGPVPQSTVAPTVDYMNSYEPSVNFMKPPLPPAVRNVPFQLISQTLPLYQQPSFQDFSFHSAPNPNFPIRMHGYYIPPKYSTIPVSYLKTEIVSVESTTPTTPTASSASTSSSVANSISITSEIPPTPSLAAVHGSDDTASRLQGLNSPSQLSSPIIFESARIPEEVAITGGVGYNQRPLTLTPEEQRNVFTAAADSSLVVAPLVFSENSVSPIRNYETIDITNQASAAFPSTTQDTNKEEATTPEPQVVTRTLPGGKRVRFRKVKKTSAAQRNA